MAKDCFRKSSLNNEDVTPPRTHDPSKGGISKASAFEQIYLQATEVVLLYPPIYHLSGMKREVCSHAGITPDLAIRGCLTTDKTANKLQNKAQTTSLIWQTGKQL